MAGGRSPPPTTDHPGDLPSARIDLTQSICAQGTVDLVRQPADRPHPLHLRCAVRRPRLDGGRWLRDGDRRPHGQGHDGTVHPDAGHPRARPRRRGSNCINSGGEKIFPEEVEEALKTHAGVDDCYVVGIPDERFGQRVVAVVGCAAGAEPPAEDDLRSHLRGVLASYKIPRQIVVVDHLHRAPNGKADYGWAREQVLATQPVAPA